MPLVLSRKIGEKLMIGDDIIVEVCRISGDKAVLGITAPESIPVYRQELWEEIQRNKQAAKVEAKS